MDASEAIDRKEQIVFDLLESQKDYAILNASFRVSIETEGESQYSMIKELFPDTIYLHFGIADEDELLDTMLDNYLDISEFIKKEGYYFTDILFTRHGDSDNYRSWEWWEMEHMAVNDFMTVEDYEEMNLRVKELDKNNIPPDFLPF